MNDNVIPLHAPADPVDKKAALLCHRYERVWITIRLNTHPDGWLATIRYSELQLRCKRCGHWKRA